MPATHILAIDQGTTSSRALVFDGDMHVVGSGQREFAQQFPRSGWVEHNPEEIWESVVWSVRRALDDAGIAASQVAGIGITNQRETVVVWDRQTGEPIHNAIVWQDRRTADMCERMKAEGLEEEVTGRTGLLLDPYFSATKIVWLLDNVADARKQAEAGRLCFGTVDTYIVWRLTGGRSFVTDATNASRTALYNIDADRWDEDLLRLFDVPANLLPEVKDCAGDFGVTEERHFGAQIPILGVAGDQQAATIGQACFQPGMVKSTYGTGCFALLNTGTERVTSQNRLLSTIVYRLDGETTYALEGSIFVAGAAVQWLRDGLKLFEDAAQSGRLAQAADDGQDVYLVPAFTGLGAPHWDAQARGAIFGLTRNTGPAEFARAALEAVCFQTRDLLDAMHRDWVTGEGREDAVLRADGGMVASDWMMQRLADILDRPVDRPDILETTALGAAWLAGSTIGIWPDRNGFADRWARDRRFAPEMEKAERRRRLEGWRDAVSRTLSQT